MMDEELEPRATSTGTEVSENKQVEEIYAQLSSSCAEVLKGMATEEVIEFRSLMQSEHPEIQNMSLILDESIKAKSISSFDQFETYLENLFVAKLDALSRLNEAKKEHLKEKKEQFLEKLMENLQLQISELPEQELEQFQEKYGGIFEGGHKEMVKNADKIVELAVKMASRW